jgi:hypothetical protein
LVLKRANTRGINCPETSKRDTSQEGLWGQIDTEFAAGSLPAGQEDTWNNKEEFKRMNCLLTLLQFL